MRSQRGLLCAMLLVSVVAVGSAFAQQTGYYVLDGFGGVHTGGGAAAIAPQTPYFGFDIAKDIVYIPHGPDGKDGVLVLDGFGGVHAGGAIRGTSLAPATPYFGFNVARAIAARSDTLPRAGGYMNAGALSIISTATYVSAGSVTLYAPKSGLILFTASAEIFCAGLGSSGSAVARMSVNIDSTNPLPSFDYPIGIADCTMTTGPTFFERVFTITAPFSVTAGSHTVHLVAKNDGGTQIPIVSDRMLTAIFVD